MALSFGDYGHSDSESRLREKLTWAFDNVFDKNVEFEQSEGVKTVTEWYKEEKEYEKERQVESYCNVALCLCLDHLQKSKSFRIGSKVRVLNLISLQSIIVLNLKSAHTKKSNIIN